MAVDPVQWEDKKILITGPTSQVGIPIVERLAKIADVHAMARFSNEGDEARIADMGATTIKADMADPKGHADVPDDFDYVINMAIVKSGDFEYDMAANSEGLGRLMYHCRGVKAFLHVSSTAVYNYEGHEPRREDAPLGDNHRAMFPTYSLSKIAAESVCRFAAQQFNIPTTIARLSVPYGDNGGWPYWQILMMQGDAPIDVHPEGPNDYNPIHADDYYEKMPYLLGCASSPATTLNFGGSQKVSVEEWCSYLGEITGLTPTFKDNPGAFGALTIDTTKMHDLIGPTKVDWKDGMRRMVEVQFPDLLK